MALHLQITRNIIPNSNKLSGVYSVRSEVLTTMSIKTTVFFDVTVCQESAVSNSE
jgi:hypothetical protein